MSDRAATPSGSTPAFDAGRETHVFYLFPQGEPLNDGESRLFETLPDAERNRAATFKSVIAQRQFLYGRALLRHFLGVYLDARPASIVLEKTEHGKLFLADGSDSRLEFNLTHKPGCIAAGFMRSKPIGVDVELFDPDRANEKIARRYFSKAEVEQLDGIEGEAFAWRFARFWTLKEAYIKARGLGMKLPLMDFSFAFDDADTLEQPGDGVRISFSGKIEDRAEDWQFRTAKLSHDHLLSVAIDRGRGDAAAIRLSEIDVADLIP